MTSELHAALVRAATAETQLQYRRNVLKEKAQAMELARTSEVLACAELDKAVFEHNSCLQQVKDLIANWKPMES